MLFGLVYSYSRLIICLPSLPPLPYQALYPPSPLLASAHISRSIPSLTQLVRVSPPGYGGIERVAHEIALSAQESYFSSVVFSFFPRNRDDHPSTTSYESIYLPCLKLGRLFIPLPSRTLSRLLFSRSHLYAHLPCPTVLFLTVLARFVRPRRQITVHWHSFLEPPRSLVGICLFLYQLLAIRSLTLVSNIVTTSPVLRQALIDLRVNPSKIFVASCPISPQYEALSPILYSPNRLIFKLVFVGRLASYKRVDWLIQALFDAQNLITNGNSSTKPHLILNVIGSGPKSSELRLLADQLCPSTVFFHGRLDDDQKIQILTCSDLLVLPSDSCHEAFGIVQLEAMCLGVPALAISCPLSGASWVSSLPSFPSVRTSSQLALHISRLATNPRLQRTVRYEARSRYLSLFSRQHWFESMQRILDLSV